MIELNNQLNFFLLINSITLILLILNQNENSRDYNSIVSLNPLEKFTWFSLILELGIFLIKIKNSDF